MKCFQVPGTWKYIISYNAPNNHLQTDQWPCLIHKETEGVVRQLGTCHTAAKRQTWESIQFYETLVSKSLTTIFCAALGDWAVFSIQTRPLPLLCLSLEFHISNNLLKHRKVLQETLTALRERAAHWLVSDYSKLAFLSLTEFSLLSSSASPAAEQLGQCLSHKKAACPSCGLGILRRVGWTHAVRGSSYGHSKQRNPVLGLRNVMLISRSGKSHQCFLYGPVLRVRIKKVACWNLHRSRQDCKACVLNKLSCLIM